MLPRASHAFAIGRTQVWCRFGAGLAEVWAVLAARVSSGFACVRYRQGAGLVQVWAGLAALSLRLDKEERVAERPPSGGRSTLDPDLGDVGAPREQRPHCTPDDGG